MTPEISTFRVERKRTDDGSSFELVGRLEGPAIHKLERLLAGPCSDGSVVTLDLDRLEFCDAAALALLVALTKRAHVASGDLVLRAVPNEIREMFRAEDTLTKLHIVPQRGPDSRAASGTRYLYRTGESVPFAYASSRYDYCLVRDGSLWAHDSHNWLLAAGTGAVLAHRTRGSYFSPTSGELMYSEQPADAPIQQD
jgi:ABC-type transporter Mla MlaB component